MHSLLKKIQNVFIFPFTMRASDLFKEPTIKICRDGENEYEEPLTKSQKEWKSLGSQFFSTVSYSEQNIQTESHLEVARKELEAKGVIKQEMIEQKIYDGPTRTLKPSILKDLSARLSSIADTLKELKEEEDRKRYIIEFFRGKELIKRKEKDLIVHITEKTVFSLGSIQQGAEESYIVGILYINGKEYTGYIKERKINKFHIISPETQKLCISLPSTDNSSLEELAVAIHEFRDRLNSTEIIGEYSTKKERAKVHRQSQNPGVQSKYIIFLLCALKQGLPFEKAVEMIRSAICRSAGRINNRKERCS